MDVENQQTTNGNIYNIGGNFVLSVEERNVFHALEELNEDAKFLNEEKSKIESDKTFYTIIFNVFIFVMGLGAIYSLYVSNTIITFALIASSITMYRFVNTRKNNLNQKEINMQKQIDLHNHDYNKLVREARLISRRFEKVNQNNAPEKTYEI